MPRKKGGTKPMHCEECTRRASLTWYKRQWICKDCLNGTIEPLHVEDFVNGTGALGDDGSLPGECSLEYGDKRSFQKKLDRGLRKRGLMITQQQMKDSLWAGKVQEG